MIALYFTAAGMALYSGQIVLEWLAIHRRYAKSAAESFGRVENIYPKFSLKSAQSSPARG